MKRQQIHCSVPFPMQAGNSLCLDDDGSITALRSKLIDAVAQKIREMLNALRQYLSVASLWGNCSIFLCESI